MALEIPMQSYYRQACRLHRWGLYAFFWRSDLACCCGGSLFYESLPVLHHDEVNVDSPRIVDDGDKLPLLVLPTRVAVKCHRLFFLRATVP